jgi:hypothetical protein
MPQLATIIAIVVIGFLLWMVAGNILYGRKRARLLAPCSPEQQEALKELERHRRNLGALGPWEPLTSVMRPIHLQALVRQATRCQAQGIPPETISFFGGKQALKAVQLAAN